MLAYSNTLSEMYTHTGYFEVGLQHNEEYEHDHEQFDWTGRENGFG